MDNIQKILLRDYSVDIPYIDKSGRGKKWVRFGFDNNYPQFVLDIVNESPLQKAIIENKISYIIGAGIEKTKDNVFSPNMHDSWNDLIYKCVVDYVYLGAFSLQVCLNSKGNKFLFYHQPVDQVRLGNYNENNIIETAYISTNWLKNNSSSIREIKMFGSETPKKR